LDAQPDAIESALGALATAHPGLRLPGAADGFEIAVRAVLGQQITVAAARTLAARVAAEFGEPLTTPIPQLSRLFPSAHTIAGLTPDALGTLGVLSKRSATIIALARAIDSGQLELSPRADPQSTIARLLELPGIGDWTAQYIAMRALSWPDAFPATDYGVMKALGTTKRSEVEARSQAWRPWRGYAVMHLWSSL
jgi:AraC family transcriptional regulator of adaptative response / DNA-3-methyladenine glycosylase II